MLCSKVTDIRIAHILSSPVRTCNLTGIRMPSFFHNAFCLRRHPQTGKLWHLPITLKLTKEELASENARNARDGDLQNQEPTKEEPANENARNARDGNLQKQPPNSTEIVESGLNDTRAQMHAPVIAKAPMSISTTTPVSSNKDPQLFHSSSYIISQFPALAYITTLKPRDFSKIIPARWKDTGGIDVNPREIVWREDMDTFTVELMRKRVMHLLGYIGQKEGGMYIQHCVNYKRVEGCHQTGAVLWLENQEEDSSTGRSPRQPSNPRKTSSRSYSSNPPPPPYATIVYKSRHIPLFNLQHLLGDTHLQSLRGLGSPFDGGLAVVKAKRNTVPLMIWLWKLMGFMGDEGTGKGQQRE